MLRCKESAQQRNLTEKKSRGKEVSQQKSPTSKKSHQQRDLTTKKSHSKKAHSKEVSQQTKFHSKKASQQRRLIAKKPHSKEVSQQRHLTSKVAHWNWQRRLRFQDLNVQNWNKVLHESFVFTSLPFTCLKDASHESFAFTTSTFTSSTFTFWGKSRTKASFPQVSTFTFWGMPRTKASFSHLQHSFFEGSLRSHIFNFHFLWEVSSWKIHQLLCFAEQNVHRKVDGEGPPRDGFGTRSAVVGSCSGRSRGGTDSSSFIFTTSTFQIWGRARTKASFSQVQLSLFEAALARQLRFHKFNFHFLRQPSHESFVFTSSTFTFWGKSRTKASFPQVQLSLFEGSLARKLRFHIFNIL